jgi:hypothetical protein
MQLLLPQHMARFWYGCELRACGVGCTVYSVPASAAETRRSR